MRLSKANVIFTVLIGVTIIFVILSDQKPWSNLLTPQHHAAADGNVNVRSSGNFTSAAVAAELNLETTCIHVAFLFVLPDEREEEVLRGKLREKLSKALSSLVLNKSTSSRNNTTNNSVVVCLHLITNEFTRILTVLPNDVMYKLRLHVQIHNIDLMYRLLVPYEHALKSNFGNLPLLYYASFVLHRAFTSVEKLILLDVDIWLSASIEELHSWFDQFDETHLIGIAHEQQPVYGNQLSDYRLSTSNESTVGLPLPGGNPGFNSGVLLLHLIKLRQSALFESFINVTTIEMLAQKYRFKGHLGDQDYYTLIGFEQPRMFKLLPCTWNRQLCKWWKYHTNKYHSNLQFDEYHSCVGDIKLYHGNCNSAIPTNV